MTSYSLLTMMLNMVLMLNIFDRSRTFNNHIMLRECERFGIDTTFKSEKLNMKWIQLFEI